MTEIVMRTGIASLAAFAWASAHAQAETGSASPIALSTNPERVCLDARPNPHLNFDLIIRNGTGRALNISEVRGVVLNRKGEMVERRILWQDALSLLAPDKTIAAGSEGMIYNPFTYNSVKEGSRIRYDVAFEGEAAPAELVVEPQSCVSKTRLISPVTGRVLVHDGHDFLSHHRRQSYQMKADLKSFGLVDNWYRFGIDLIPVDAKGAFFKGDGSRIEDWFGWGAPVRAAGAGIVAAVRDDQPDNDIGTTNRYVPKKLTEDEMDSDGNYVLIDHGNGEFSLASHLREGSARVRKGDRVKARDIIAEMGSSGSSPVPHVHYELRTGWGVKGVRSLPPYFRDIAVIGTGEGGARPVAVNTGDVYEAR